MARYKIDQRIDEFEACASALEWSYKKDDDWGMIKWLLDFKLFRQGHRQKITPLIIHETDDLGFTCSFDYCYTISSNNSSHTYRQTVYFRYSKALALPHFVMVPEKWYHRIGTYFGMQDINFVQYPTFSKNYLLRGEDEDYIRYHFDNPDMVRYFDSQGFYSMEGMNYLMILYVHNVVMPRQQILQLVNIGNTLHNFFAGKTPGIDLPEYKYPI
ncbi:MAG: hypothetical protein IPP15_17875 [Saprospiraceae bacterium]|uniref:Uncharacterized protein n=1 Tax=Candidatus Opimibacter skivensis TaxID=2982028 RepID=A0A9D7SVT7_9BACT|nr:hypothetical protein [Candidatus Opimibacter skivensis]